MRHNSKRVVKLAMEHGCVTVKDFAFFIKEHHVALSPIL